MYYINHICYIMCFHSYHGPGCYTVLPYQYIQLHSHCRMGPHGSDDSELSPEHNEPVMYQIHTDRTNEAVRRQYSNERDTVIQTGRRTDRHMDKYTYAHIYIYNSILIWELTILKSGARTPRTVTKIAVKTAIDLTQTKIIRLEF